VKIANDRADRVRSGSTPAGFYEGRHEIDARIQTDYARAACFAYGFYQPVSEETHVLERLVLR
jgi:hypothetical protein